jgi:6-phosphofructokinase
LKRKIKIGILTGGGDTQPLNAVIFSLRNLLSKMNCEFIGFVKGWEGVLNNRFVDLAKVPDFRHIGGTFLKSSRVNLSTQDGFVRANRNLSDVGVDCLVVIGGDDTLSNVYGIESVFCLAASKTIDNDVGTLSLDSDGIHVLNYFALGYPTAANMIARFVSLEEGLRTTAYSHERILIVESMGMEAGWLAMASSFGRPDFIIIPEFPLDYLDFLDKLKSMYAAKKHAVIVIAEGARFKDGGFLHENAAEADAFGNPRLGGASGILSRKLKIDLEGFMDVRNINAVNPSYLYRSGAPDPLDLEAAGLIAERCVRHIADDDVRAHRFIHIQYDGSRFRADSCGFSDFPKTDRGRFPKRSVDHGFYDSTSYVATDAWMRYGSPIVRFRQSETRYLLSLGASR